MTTENYIRLEDEYGARNYKPLDVVLTRGKGVWVWDVEGEKYLDCRSLGVDVWPYWVSVVQIRYRHAPIISRLSQRNL